MTEDLSVWNLLLQLLKTPSPWIGALIGAILTGGGFGWWAHIRGIRPVLVFFRDETESAPKWKVKNVGTGPAMHVRMRDYGIGDIDSMKVHMYPIAVQQTRPLDWVTHGVRLEVDYTDIYGRRWYRSIADDNDSTFTRRFCSFWRRPPKRFFKGYAKEIHTLRSLKSRT